MNEGLPFEQQMRPFNFYIVSNAGGTPVIAPYERDPAKWPSAGWVRTGSGDPISNDERQRLRKVGDFLDMYFDHYSAEWLDYKGNRVSSKTLGVLQRRPIRDGRTFYLTKVHMEVSDDPGVAMTAGSDPRDMFEAHRVSARASKRRTSARLKTPVWGIGVREAIRAIGIVETAERLTFERNPTIGAIRGS